MAKRTYARIQTAAVATGNGDNLPVEDMATVLFDVQGTFVGTVAFEARGEGTGWVPLSARPSTGGSPATTTTAAGVFRADVAGFRAVRARVAAWTSGTITVDAYALDIPMSAWVDMKRIEDCVLIDSQELAGAVTATPCPTLVAKFVRFKARSDNAGSVYLGLSDVTKPDGTGDVTSGFELVAGDDTGWLPATNLNNFSRICDNAGDDLTCWVLA